MLNRLDTRALATGVALAAGLALAAPAAAGSLEDTIGALNAEWDAALNEGDAAAVAALYAEDARVVTGGGDVVDGREAIEALFQGFIDSGFHDHAIDMLSVDRRGDVVWETAEWSGVGGNGETYGGHLVTVYTRGEDGWQAALHIWN